MAKKIVSDGGEVHLVGRDENSLSILASELNASFTTCDVLEENFSEKSLKLWPLSQISHNRFSMKKSRSTWHWNVYKRENALHTDLAPNN